MGCVLGQSGKRFYLKDYGYENEPNMQIVLSGNAENDLLSVSKVFLALLQDNLYQLKKNNALREANYELSTYWDFPWGSRHQQVFDYVNKSVKRILNVNESTVTYVIHRSVLLQLTSIPKHEVARQNGWLVEIPVTDLKKWMWDNLFPKGIAKYCCFYSHKWIGNSPDSADHTLLKLIQSDLTRRQFVEFCWIDYSSVPQEDNVAKLTHLYAIPKVMGQMGLIALHPNNETKVAYDNSVWCQLECIALLETSSLSLVENRPFTIYDWSDLDAVLPGFIELYTGAQKHIFFTLDGKFDRIGWKRAFVLAELLKAFITNKEAKRKG